MSKGMKKRNCARLSVVLVLCTMIFAAAAAAGEYLTIVGEVNYDFQIVTDADQVYEILMNNTGYDLTDHIGEKVRVVGMLVEEGDEKYLDVQSFEVLEEDAHENSEPSDEGTGETAPKE